MARNTLKGLSYFNVDCVEQDNLEYVQLLHGITGYGIVVKLWRRIYMVEGYFCRWDNKTILQFAKKEIGVEIEVVNSVVDTCLNEGIFSQKMFDNHGILTSKGIQKRWLKIVTDCKRKDRDIDPIFDLLPKTPEFNAYTPEDSAYTHGESTQRKEKKRKEEESKEEREGEACTFVPPTPLDLNNFFREEEQLIISNWSVKKCHSEAQKFVDHYTSVGWKIGRAKVPMQDWRSSGSKWITTDQKWEEENRGKSVVAPNIPQPVGRSQAPTPTAEPTPEQKKQIAIQAISSAYHDFISTGHYEDFGNAIFRAFHVTLSNTHFNEFISNRDEYYKNRGYDRIKNRKGQTLDMKNGIMKTIEDNALPNIDQDQRAIVEGRKEAIRDFFIHLVDEKLSIQEILN